MSIIRNRLPQLRNSLAMPRSRHLDHHAPARQCTDIGAVLRHEPGSRLMSPHYVGDNQACIDKATVAALAANRKLPLSSFDWCEG